MAYRSIKRVIGETSLERKCRILFVFFLSALLFVAFYLVESIAEKLVEGTAVRKGRDLVDASLLRYHWEEVWETKPEAAELAREMSRDLQTQQYKWTILALDRSGSIESGRTVEVPASEEEEAILRKLKERFQRQMAEGALRPDGDPALDRDLDIDDSAIGIASPPSDAKSAPDIVPVHEMLAVPSERVIQYYQPVYWKNSCLRCHEGFEGVDAFDRADAALSLDKGTYPFRVVRVTIPDRETQQARTWSRALLTAIGIFTVFLAMVILYVIIRYVVVRPLQHLRDVSEEISRGNTELRA